MLLERLGPDWIPELAISLGKRRPGFPTAYKVDLALPSQMLAVEVDGFSHCSRRDLDAKKDAALAELGWTVLRFSNQEILDSLDSVAEQIASRCTTSK